MFKAKVSADFYSIHLGTLKLKQGEVITVTNTQHDKEWWEGENSKGVRGVFPKSHIAVSDSSNFSQHVTNESLDLSDADSDSECDFSEPDNSPQREQQFCIFRNKHGNHQWMIDTAEQKILVSSTKLAGKYAGVKKFTAYQLSTSDSENVVWRRYKHFVWVHKQLSVKFSCIAVPPLPRTKLFGRFNTKFIERRKMHLQAFVDSVSSHPILSTCQVWDHFISTNEPKQWKRGKRNAENDNMRGAMILDAISFDMTTLANQEPSNIKNHKKCFNKSVSRLSKTVKFVQISFEDRQLENIKQCSKLSENFYKRYATCYDKISKSIEVDDNDIGRIHTFEKTVKTAELFGAISQSFRTNRNGMHLLELAKLMQFYRNLIPQYVKVNKNLKVAKNNDKRQHIKNCCVLAEQTQFRIKRDKNLKMVTLKIVEEDIVFYSNLVDKLKEIKELFSMTNE